MSGSAPILVFNSGSSSLKFGVFGAGTSDEQMLLHGSADGIGRDTGTLRLQSADGSILLQKDHILETQDQALSVLAGALHEHLSESPIAVGHRVVHGGPHLREHTVITSEVLQQLEAAIHFAPLHIPEALRIIRASQGLFPASEQIACFDTSFHRTMPDVATHLPLPTRYFDAGVQRYGFHGLSCESVMHRLSPAPERLVIAHLGSGSSVTAVRDRRSIDTSMGLSPAGGFPMATRSGDLDPGVLLYILRTENPGADALEQLLNHECGMTGLSNGESDMRALQRRAQAGDAAAALACDVFCTDVRKAIGSYAALMGGLDLLVFTGGIGQNSSDARSAILQGLDFLGLSADGQGNGKVLVLPAEEEVQIARDCRRVLNKG